MIKDVEGFGAKVEMEPFVNRKAALQRSIQRPKRWVSNIIPSQCTLSDGSTVARDSFARRNAGKGRRVESPVSRNRTRSATVQINGYVWDQVRKVLNHAFV